MAKIIIAEDEQSTRLLLARIVESLGHTAIQASSGDRALACAEDNADCKLLITDMEMPGLSGRQLIRKLRGAPLLKNLPIVIVSGVVPLKEITDLLESGASRFMPKPIDAAQLKEYVKLFTQS